jgi:RNA polymerase sigma-70 factor (ECF subfamily)
VGQRIRRRDRDGSVRPSSAARERSGGPRTRLREQAGLVLAALTRSLGDLDLAEEAFGEAMARALEHWPRRGVPEQPAAWLLTAARRSAIDRIRHHRMQASKEDAVRWSELERFADTEDAMPEGAGPIPDERLRLIFTCCHPALALESRVALTLRTLCGLGTAQAAQAFLVSEATMAQRLVRAKKKIRDARIPSRAARRASAPRRRPVDLVPAGTTADEDGERAHARRGDRLGGSTLLPDEPEVLGLSLMLCEARPGALGNG